MSNTYIYGEWKVRIEYDSNNNAIYVGETRPGISVSSAHWRIKKITYDTSNNATQINWANSSNDFSFIWNDRSTYTYG